MPATFSDGVKLQNAAHKSKSCVVSLAFSFLMACILSTNGYSAPQIWFAPLDPLLRPEVDYGGSSEYMKFFQTDSPWSTAVVGALETKPEKIGEVALSYNVKFDARVEPQEATSATTASGRLPAEIALYVQRVRFGDGLETR